MNKIIDSILSFLFGIRVKGEPIDLSYPPSASELPPVDQSFFKWSNEFRIGCLAKHYTASY